MACDTGKRAHDQQREAAVRGCRVERFVEADKVDALARQHIEQREHRLDLGT